MYSKFLKFHWRSLRALVQGRLNQQDRKLITTPNMTLYSKSLHLPRTKLYTFTTAHPNDFLIFYTRCYYHWHFVSLFSFFFFKSSSSLASIITIHFVANNLILQLCSAMIATDFSRERANVRCIRWWIQSVDDLINNKILQHLRIFLSALQKERRRDHAPFAITWIIVTTDSRKRNLPFIRGWVNASSTCTSCCRDRAIGILDCANHDRRNLLYKRRIFSSLQELFSIFCLAI